MNTSFNPTQTTLLKHPFFRLYLLATFVSYFGTGMHFVALSWLVLELTGSATQLGIILGLAVLPSIFVSVPAGVLADRLSRKKIAVCADFGRFFVVGMVPLLGLMPGHIQHVGIIYAMEIALAILTPFFNIAAASLVRECVAKADLLHANRAKEITVHMASLLGAGLAGIMVDRFSANGALAIDAFTFLASAICFALVRAHPHAALMSTKRKSVFKSALDGWGYVRRNPALMPTMGLAIIPYVMVKGLNVVLPEFVREGLGADAKIFGVIDAAFAVGAIAGGAALAALLKKLNPSQLLGRFFLFLTLAVIGFAASRGIIVPAIYYAMIGFSVLSLKALLGTILQTDSDVSMIGRVQGLQTLLQSGITPIMLILTGKLTDEGGPRMVIVFYAGLASIGLCRSFVPTWIGYVTKYFRKGKMA